MFAILDRFTGKQSETSGAARPFSSATAAKARTNSTGATQAARKDSAVNGLTHLTLHDGTDQPLAGCRIFGGLNIREDILDSRQALVTREGLVFSEVINAKLNLSASYSSNLAVAQITANSKQIIFFINPNTISEEEVRTVVEIAKRQGFVPANGIQAHFASSNVVLPLVQGTWTTESVKADREIRKDGRKNALFSAFTDLFAWAYANKANDVDFVLKTKEAESHVAMKISGKYKVIPRFNMPTESMRQILGLVWQRSIGGSGSSFSEITDTQCQVELELPASSILSAPVSVRLRWSGAPYDGMVVITMRIQPIGDAVQIRSIEDAGYTPEEIKAFDRVIHSHGGMVILAGEVGSGKSTSLAAVIARLPDDMKKISIEDPVELMLPGVYQRTIARDLNSTDSSAFVAATRSVFRSALDMMFLGEIRDVDTGSLARALAESGHGVFTTIHARDGLGIIDRLISPAIGIPRDVVAAPGIIKLLVFQALMPTNCPHCRMDIQQYFSKLSGKELALAERQVQLIELLYKISPSTLRFRDKEGCQHCRKDEVPELNGYAGRTVVSEMIELDDRMLDLINQANSVELRRYWRSLHKNTYDQDRYEGRTVIEAAIYRASLGIIDPRDIETQFSSFETILKKEGSQHYGVVQK